MKKPYPPEGPKHCPCGHIHVSWSAGEEEVYCWDCDRRYPVAECSGPPVTLLSQEAEEEPAE